MFTYRGKTFTAKDIGFINQLIANNPGMSRWALSRELCRQWNWVQPNGALRDMVCRSLMLELHRAGHIRLPDKKRSVFNPLAERKKPEPIPIDQKPIQAELCDQKPLKFRQVR
jgi:hypothetical protein